MGLRVNNSLISLKAKNIVTKGHVQKNPFAQFGVTEKKPAPVGLPLYYYNLPQNFIKNKDFTVPNVGMAHSFELSNGHKVIILPKKGSFEINTVVKTDPQEDTTLSHFVEHLIANRENIFKNSTFKNQLDKIGATKQATTTPNEISYQISYPFDDKKDIDTIIQMQAKMLQTPQFSKEKFELEKGVLACEFALDASENEKADIENNILKRRIVNSLFGTNLSLTCDFNKKDTLKQLSLKNVQDFYNKYYRNNNMQTVIVGDVDPNEIIKTFAKYFNKPNTISKKIDTAYVPITLPQKAKRLDFKFDFNKENVAQINFPAFEYGSGGDLMIFKVLSELAKIRKKDFSLDLINASNYGIKPVVISVAGRYSTPCANENLNQLQNDFLSFLNTKITEEELEIIKKRIKTVLLVQSEENSFLTECLQTKNPDSDYPIQGAKYLNELTLQDIEKFIAKYFNFNNALYLTASDSPQTSSISFKGSKDAFELKAQEFVYPNNLQLIVNSDADNKTASYRLYFPRENLGDIKSITADILLCMLQYAIKYNLPGEIVYKPDTFLTDDAFEISGYSNPEDILKLINFINKVVQYRGYSEEFLEEIKQILKNEMQDDFFMAKLTNLEFGDNPNAMQLEKIVKKEDKIKAIDSVTLGDVLNLLNQLTKNVQAKAVVAVNKTFFEENRQSIFSAVNKGFNYQFKPKKEIEPLVNKSNPSAVSKVLFDITDTPSANVCFSYKISNIRNEKDAIMADMLSVVLDDRIFRSIREKYGIGYNPVAAYEHDCGLNYIKIQCDFENNPKNKKDFEIIVKQIQSEIKDICTKPISKEELESLKLKYKKYWLELSFSARGKAGLLSTYSIEENNQKYKTIDSISEDELLECAKTHFSTKPNIIIKASKDLINSNIGYIITLGQLI